VCHELLARGWLRIKILPISAYWVATTTGVTYWYLAYWLF
jgi:hypothetical protein